MKFILALVVALFIGLVMPMMENKSEAGCGRGNRPHRLRTWLKNRPHHFFHGNRFGGGRCN